MHQSFYTLSNLAHNAIPYDQYKVSDYLPALEEAINIAKEKLQQWKNDTTLSFKNTIVAFDAITEEVGVVSNIFHNMHVAHCTPELQAIAENFSSIMTKFQLSLTLDDQVFAKIKKYYDQADTKSLSVEENRILDKIYQDFVRNGALLNPDDKKKLEKIDEELASLQIKFSENVLKATKSVEFHFTNLNELKGIPASALEEAKHQAQKRKKEGWVFTLDHASYLSIMKYAESSALREKVFKAQVTRATSGEWNNKPIIKKNLELKLERAKLLGFESYASYVLEQRMAKDVKTVKDFSSSLYLRAYKKAKEEFEQLKDFAKAKGHHDFKKWDTPYFSERLKEEQYSFNEEEVKPYFPLEQVLSGVFELSNRLYDLKFKKIHSVPTYAPDIEVYEVFDANNNFVSLLYLDFFTRETKKQGAWMTAYREQGHQFGKDLRPHIGIVCNFTKGNAEKPSLLTWIDVLTLFHEFGHALHGMLSNCKYKYLSGTNVYWDFVELPSQIMENWVKSQECLKIFAKHYQTKEVLPAKLMEKIIAADRFQSGLMTLRQLSFGMLDLMYHEQTQISELKNCERFENEILKNYSFLPPVDGESLSCGFTHIFSGGYAAGYYSYKWAEVLDADAFAAFQEKGIFNKELAKSFKDNILSRGGSEDPTELYIKFRGRKPEINALIERLGL